MFVYKKLITLASSVLIALICQCDVTDAMNCKAFNGNSPPIKLVHHRMYNYYNNQRMYSIPIRGKKKIYVYLDVDVNKRLPSNTRFNVDMSIVEAHADVKVFGVMNKQELPVSCDALKEQFPAMKTCHERNLGCDKMEQVLAGTRFSCPPSPGAYRDLLGRAFPVEIPDMGHLLKKVPWYVKVIRAVGTGQLVITKTTGSPVACVQLSMIFTP